MSALGTGGVLYFGVLMHVRELQGAQACAAPKSIISYTVQVKV